MTIEHPVQQVEVRNFEAHLPSRLKVRNDDDARPGGAVDRRNRESSFLEIPAVLMNTEGSANAESGRSAPSIGGKMTPRKWTPTGPQLDPKGFTGLDPSTTRVKKIERDSVVALRGFVMFLQCRCECAWR